ncbi:MAG: four helix bundle protein [Bacteroidota bacterium]|jgi:hypothetical protein
MDPDELKVRTKKFALNVMELTEKLPHTRSGDVLGRQLLRSATSVGANYRAACRARSRADFISKVSIVEKEQVMVPLFVQRSMVATDYLSEPNPQSQIAQGHVGRTNPQSRWS